MAPGRHIEFSSSTTDQSANRNSQHTPSKPSIKAAALTPVLTTANQEFEIDEDLIKESPPRSSSETSFPRPLGEMLDEEEELLHSSSSPTRSTPSPITRKPVPSRASSDTASAVPLPLPVASLDDSSRRASANSLLDHEPHSESDKSPLRRVSKRIPSQTIDGGSRESTDSMANKIVYEKFDGKHGERLTSIKPPDEDTQPTHTNKLKTERPKHDRKYSRDDLVSGRHAGAGWESSSIRFAPLNVPLKRRLQTLMVLLHTLSIATFVAVFFFLCAVPVLWPILVPYLIYVLFSNAPQSGQLTYRSEWLRRLPIWSLFASYFPARLHRTQILPPTRKYLFGYHPHGIISHGAFAAFATEALGFSQLFPGITNTLLTLETNFRLPLYRDYALRMGLASVSRESCENILTRGGPNGEGMGRAITIVVGGAREALDAQPRSLRLVLKKRKGFVKMAIRTGADLVPVLAFGENELYEQLQPQEHPNVHKVQLLVKKVLGFTVPLFHARGVFNYDVGLLPYRRPVDIVVGRPIEIVQQAKPDPKYVDEIHARYVQELLGIWDEWRDVFGRGTRNLRIVE